jgi:hypothetical protein
VRNAGGDLPGHAEADQVGEDQVVADEPEVHVGDLAAEDHLHRFRGRQRHVQAAREVVGRTERQNAQRDVPMGDVSRGQTDAAVAAADNQQVGSLLEGGVQGRRELAGRLDR